MCIFTGPVTHVAETKIFARRLGGSSQALIYAMEFGAEEDLAMVLPLPVPPDSMEDAVEFVDLSSYPGLFDDLERAFPSPPGPRGLGAPQPRAASAPLVVHEVGAFEASFVPSIADFGRLDARFRLPAQAWAKLGDYADWGFAVFKLRKTNTAPVHPMAFTFPNGEAGLFFPTVHIHDGRVHRDADFSHRLYWQGTSESAGLPPIVTSTGPAAQSVDVSKTAGLIDGAASLQRMNLFGNMHNRDWRVQLRED